MRDTGADNAIVELAARRDANTPIVQKRALAALGGEEFIVHRIVDHGRDDDAVLLQRKRYGELRDAVQEIRRAVERIDDEALRGIGAADGSAFFEQEADIGPRLLQFLDENVLGAAIG